jgi:hypothetical protein
VDRIEQEIEDQIRRREAIHRRPEVQRAMARLRLVTDERQGKESPQWVRDLAERELPPRGR